MLGTERHESRRIDNQLRGRSGRQGDPGRSKFYLSLQDDLMRIFGSDRMDGMLQKLGLKEDEAIIHPWINKAIEQAQAKVEARNFDIRKNILKYDNVMNDQRKVVFEQRIEFMAEESVRDTIDDMRHGVIDDIVSRAHPRERLCRAVGRRRPEGERRQLPQPRPADRGMGEGGGHRRRRDPRAHHQGGRRGLRPARRGELGRGHELRREAGSAADPRPSLARAPRHPRPSASGHRLARLAQRDPLNEYKSEAFELFNAMIGHLREQVTGQLMRIQVVFQQPEPPQLPPMFAQHLDPATGENEFDLAQGNAFGAGQALGFTAAANGSGLAPRPERPVHLGPGRAATSRAPAAPARSSSIATASSSPDGRQTEPLKEKPGPVPGFLLW